jgi:serine/threonine-protein kinase
MRPKLGGSPTGSTETVDPWLRAKPADVAGWADHVAEGRSEQDAQTQALQRVRQWLAPGHPELLGKLVDYDVESVIGQGGFGVVLRAFDRELNRPVAIKVLTPHLATVGAARRRFIREAQAAAAVVHPNVVPIHAVQAEAEYPFLVMTYVPGGSLQQCVRRHGPLEPKSIVRIAQQVAAGLAAAHRQGLVHRDIKPGNILLENGLNRALITDFGLARAADDAASQTGWLAGTPHYMSPEQAASESLDGRSDLFSLGSVMYFMATGREPFGGDKALAILNQIAHKRPSAIRSINADIPNTLVRIIDRLLEKRPADRFQSASQLSELLEQYLAYLQQPDARVKPRLPRPTAQGNPIRAGLLSGAAMLLMAAAGYYGWHVPERARSLGSAGASDGSANASPALDDASINAANAPTGRLEPQLPGVEDQRFRSRIEWQQAEATWWVEDARMAKELAVLNAAVQRLEQTERANRWSLPEAIDTTWEPGAADVPPDGWPQEVRHIKDRLRALEGGSGD